MSTQYRLVTSNENKLSEFKRLAGGLTFIIEKGIDLKEVKSTNPIEVATYKALAAGVGCIVEDTILVIDGIEVTDIRYRLDELLERTTTTKLSWITTLAVCHRDRVSIYSGEVTGRFSPVDSIPKDAFGFDPFFVPDGTNYSLYELEQLGLKDKYSARKLAIDSLQADECDSSISFASIPEWKGEYQE